MQSSKRAAKYESKSIGRPQVGMGGEIERASEYLQTKYSELWWREG